MENISNSLSTGRLSHRQQAADALISLIETAQRSIVIFAPQLDRGLYNSQRFNRALALFCTRHGRNRAVILTEDGKHFLRVNELLIQTTRKFSDFIIIRQVTEEYRGLTTQYLVVDKKHFLIQPDTREQAYIVHTEDESEAAHLLNQFAPMLERSEPIYEMHTLGL